MVNRTPEVGAAIKRCQSLFGVRIKAKVSLLYLVDDNPALWDTYQDALLDFATKAEKLAVLLRKGARLEQLRLGPGPS